MNVRRLLWNKRDTDPYPYEVAIIDAGSYQVQVLESPRKRSVQVHVNGQKVWPK